VQHTVWIGLEPHKELSRNVAGIFVVGFGHYERIGTLWVPLTVLPYTQCFFEGVNVLCLMTCRSVVVGENLQSPNR
jgi:hypothetical protein